MFQLICAYFRVHKRGHIKDNYNWNCTALYCVPVSYMNKLYNCCILYGKTVSPSQRPHHGQYNQKYLLIIFILKTHKDTIMVKILLGMLLMLFMKCFYCFESSFILQSFISFLINVNKDIIMDNTLWTIFWLFLF